MSGSQTVSFVAKYNSNSGDPGDSRSFNVAECSPGPLSWATSGFTIPAITYIYDAGLGAKSFTTSAANRANACPSCPSSITYSIKIGPSYTTDVSSSVFTSITSSSFVINTNTL